MKKMNARQMMLCMAGSVMCSVGVMGCYPLVPAYFAALYLERVSGPVLLGMMYIGMFVFMPTAAAVKYAVALVVVMGAIRLVEWANEGCPSYMAGSMAAIITMILSVAGGLLEWKDQPGILAAALEGAFILGAVILFNRALHMILHWGRKAGVPERPDGGREERLLGYAESFQGLSQVFHSMSAAHQNGAAEELGQIQNELTGKICASQSAGREILHPYTARCRGSFPRSGTERLPGRRKSRSLHSIAGTAAIWWRRRCASLSVSA